MSFIIDNEYVPHGTDPLLRQQHSCYPGATRERNCRRRSGMAGYECVDDLPWELLVSGVSAPLSP